MTRGGRCLLSDVIMRAEDQMLAGLIERSTLFKNGPTQIIKIYCATPEGPRNLFAKLIEEAQKK